MSFSIYEASAPVFVASLANMSKWLDKAAAEKDEKTLIEARLAPDMHPLPKQFQIASDTAKFAVARLTGAESPKFEDNEASFAELKQRCDKTIAYIQSVSAAAFDESEDREVQIKFPNGMGYRFSGRDYLTKFALPNFFFHVTAAYAILRNQGVAVGKPDFLQHLGMPTVQD